MQRRFAWAAGLVLGIVALLAGPPAGAVIMRLTPLKDVLAESQFIFLARVENIQADKPAVILSVGQSYKGKVPFKRLAINLTGDSQAQKNKHTAQLLKRLAPDLPLVLFANQRGQRFTVFAFSNGTWFQIVGRKSPDSDRVLWTFTHCEPFLRRTFAGTTAALRRIVVDGLAKKKAPPEPNAKEKPGLGPEVGADSKNNRQTKMQNAKCKMQIANLQFAICNLQFPIAVIPTLGLGGPLAVLAILFPSLFGGVILLFRSWKALITVASVNSTLLILHLWLGRILEDTWLGPPRTLWFVMLLVTLAGTLWAWRRHLPEQAADLSPTRSEKVVLWLSSLTFLAAFLWYWCNGLDGDDPTWKLLLALSVSFGAGTLYVLARPLVPRRTSLPTEGLILWTMIVASTCLAAFWPGSTASVSGRIEKRAASVAVPFEGGTGSVQPKWTFVPEGKLGLIVSSCLGHGHRVYAAAALRQGNDQYGVLYRLNAQTGAKLWEFDDHGEMKSAFSSPCIADGRLYIGEGFHTDPDCKLYCVNADTGKKLWEFPTTSHTESSPVVVAGKVFFGAGDDGVYCVDAAKEKKGQGVLVWHYPGKDSDTTPTVAAAAERSESKQPLQLHVDTTPAVVNDRLYAGSGIGRKLGEPGDPAVFCLDARTGKKLWLLALARNLPAWGSPVVAGEQVFFGIGNGDMFDDAANEKPAGALLGVHARTGQELWRYPVGNGVLDKPVVDGTRVYFGARDGYCYAVDRKNGHLCWKANLGSPVVASPVLVRCEMCGTSEYLYALATGGQVVCLNPATGAANWTYRFEQGTYLASTPFLVVNQTSSHQTIRLYLGAGFANRSVPAVCCLVHEILRHPLPAKP